MANVTPLKAISGTRTASGDVTGTPTAIGEFATNDVIPPEHLGSGTPSANTFLRGDGTWATVATTPTVTAPNAPSNTAPANGASAVNSASVTLTSTAFSGSSGDSHALSQWQVSADATFTTTIVDSGDSTALTSYTTTALSPSTTYYFRVRHKGLVGGWSAYSTATNFATAVASGSQSFTGRDTPLSDTFTVPANVYRIRVRATGGGGSAYNTDALAAPPQNAQYSSVFGGGGGGGGTVEAILTVTPGESFPISLGARVRNVAGAAFSDSPGFTGPSASFGTSITAFGGGPASRELGGVGGGGVGGTVTNGENGESIVQGVGDYPYGGAGGNPGRWSNGNLPTGNTRIGMGGDCQSITSYYDGQNLGSTGAPLIVVEWGPGI